MKDWSKILASIITFLTLLSWLGILVFNIMIFWGWLETATNPFVMLGLSTGIIFLIFALLVTLGGVYVYISPKYKESLQKTPDEYEVPEDEL